MELICIDVYAFQVNLKGPWPVSSKNPGSAFRDKKDASVDVASYQKVINAAHILGVVLGLLLVSFMNQFPPSP